MTYKRDRVVHVLKRTVASVVITVMLVFPAGQAFAAGTLLKVGSRGAEVTQLQQELKNQGFFNYWKVTNYFGSITRNAVITFQKNKGLTPDGIVGSKTNAALYSNSSSVSRGTVSQQARNDIYWLARIIQAESQGEPYRGQVAVGNIIMNRVKSSSFPNSVYGVIFEYYGSIPQFSPVADGTIYNTPSDTSIKAAEEAYAGNRPVGSALYFFNPKKAAGSWIVKTRIYLETIGNHAFYQ
ncbi:MAG: cell wall hydrolase [Firmicutes bacterium]|nr:cell wall hydrolase [Bacillota bacterium]